jgi:hypothetical protein
MLSMRYPVIPIPVVRVDSLARSVGAQNIRTMPTDNMYEGTLAMIFIHTLRDLIVESRLSRYFALALTHRLPVAHKQRKT